LLFAFLQMLFGEAKVFLLQKDNTSGGRTSSAKALDLGRRNDEPFCQSNNQGRTDSALSKTLKWPVTLSLTWQPAVAGKENPRGLSPARVQ
jgi:hypothetical protein